MAGNRRNLRRNLLKTMGAGVLATSLAGCAPAPTKRYWRPYSRKPWVAPKVSMENVIREVVGLRPYRPAGFVVRSEALGNKTVVHNYGHGGAGITLCWGSSALAVRETLGMAQRDVAVIGSGVMGLTSARLLQDAGWNVTIYTRDMARHTTSNIAGGEWGPYSVHDPEVSSDLFKSQLDFATRISHHAHTNLGGPDYGIYWKELWSPNNNPDNDAEVGNFYPFEGTLGPGEHPFPTDYAHHALTMMVEPATFLRRLTEDVRVAGGRFVIRNFRDREELFIPPDPAVDFMTLGGGSDNLYMFSRTDVILLGGTFKPGDWTMNPEPAETERIVRENQRLFAGF